MTTTIALDSASPPLASDSAIALQDQLARCTRQLCDWVACPSGKTPEGEKIIANLRARIGSLEARLGGSASVQATSAPSPSNAPPSTLGSLISVSV